MISLHILLVNFGSCFEWPFIHSCVPQCFLGIGRVGDVKCALAHQMRQGRRATQVESGARNRHIDIQVGDNIARNPRCEVLPPFGTADETVLQIVLKSLN